MKNTACGTLTAPDGIGRSTVRATLASNSLSVMSLNVQPAPRIPIAPMPNKRYSQRVSPKTSGVGVQLLVASAKDHQQGNNTSQVPMGRSKRASLKYGLIVAGSIRSNQPPFLISLALFFKLSKTLTMILLSGYQIIDAISGHARTMVC